MADLKVHSYPKRYPTATFGLDQVLREPYTTLKAL